VPCVCFACKMSHIEYGLCVLRKQTSFVLSMVLVLDDPFVESLTLSAILEKGSYAQSLFNYCFVYVGHEGGSMAE